MWPIKRQAPICEVRNRKSIKPNLDRLEDRALMTITYGQLALLPNATAQVGSVINNGTQGSNPPFYDASAKIGNSTGAYASIGATNISTRGNAYTGFTLNITDTANVQATGPNPRTATAKTTFTYKVTSNTPFKLSAIGYFNFSGTEKSGVLGELKLDGRGVKEIKLTNGRSEPVTFAENLRAGTYTLQLVGINEWKNPSQQLSSTASGQLTVSAG